MSINPEDSLVICFFGIGGTRSQSDPVQNANSLYYFPYRGNYLTKSFDGII